MSVAHKMVWAKHRWFGESAVVVCHWCSRRLNMKGSEQTNVDYCTVDHLIEKALGGSDEWENLVPACKKCNSSRSSGIVMPSRHKNMSDVMWEKHLSGGSK